jgi:hypothetical protein
LLRFVHIDESEIEDLNRVLAEARRSPDEFSLSEEVDDPSTEEMQGVFAPRATVTITCKASGLARTYRQFGIAWLVVFESELRAGVFDRKAHLRGWVG